MLYIIDGYEYLGIPYRQMDPNGNWSVGRRDAALDPLGIAVVVVA
jgi:hypothetical protein